jgi:CRISPR/Cas system-associated exonuclease Cas4 (RecB family)
MYIDHLSVSRAGIFNECHQKYKYRYHLKLISDEPEPIYFAYGTIIHRIAEIFVKCRGKEELYDVAKGVLSGDISLDDEGGKVLHPLPQTYKDRMPDHLYSLQKITDSLGFDGYVELPFEYDLDPPNEKLMVGYIDRLIMREGQAWVLDYKTTAVGAWRKNSSNIVGDLQLRAYALVVRDVYKIPAHEIRCGLYYLDGGELVSAKFTEATLDQTKAELLRVYKEIENKDPDSVWGNPGDHCKRCEWRKLCPFAKK